MPVIKRVIISVSNDAGLVTFANGLVKLGIEIIATSGTAKKLRDNNIETIAISEITGFPEILDGRVKTLHPKIFGALLARESKETDRAQMVENNIPTIGLLVCNLYPFEEVTSSPNVTFEKAIENIDIGGPAMLRAAAKNFTHVTPVVDPKDYDMILAKLQTNNCEIPLATSKRLAMKIFQHIFKYDRSIWNYLMGNEMEEDHYPEKLHIRAIKSETLRYGENSNQKAAVYAFSNWKGPSVVSSFQIQGIELSYNNYLDLDSALKIVSSFSEPAVAIIKHTNPCGVAVGNSIRQAFKSAHLSDPTSSFGGIIAFNRAIDKELAYEINQIGFIEAIIAPDFSRDTLELFGAKKKLRLLRFQPDSLFTDNIEIRSILGGLLLQDPNLGYLDAKGFQIVSEKEPTSELARSLYFAFQVARFVKSNGIVLAQDSATVGIGAGQMSRIDSVKIAVEKAGYRAKGSVLASDGFFPFRDNVDEANKAGIKAIIQPGGSIRDKEVIEAVNEHGMVMIHTGIRLFSH